MATVDLAGVSVVRSDTTVLASVDLHVSAGEITGVVGPSGSGKTTLLRVVAGLDKVSSGAVYVDGADVTERHPGARNMAFVFQLPALQPTRSVRGNIAMPLELRRDPVEEIRKRVGAEARALHIEQLLGASPRTLSAGEAQAVQIARAMVKRPSVLLLDEPFARVDLDLAAVLRRELLLIQRGFGVTTLLVTNDPEDAMSMPSSLVALERGAVVQVATPTEMYERPRTLGAALSTGDTNALTVHVEHDGHGAWLTHEAFRIRDWRPALRATGRRFQLLVRPSWWRLDPHGVPSATVERTSTLPGLPSTVRLGADLVRAFLPGVRIGETVSLRPDRWVLIDPRTGYCVDG